MAAKDAASGRGHAGRVAGRGTARRWAGLRPPRGQTVGWLRSTMIRISVMSSIAQRRPSRPRPESLTPPYGMWSIR